MNRFIRAGILCGVSALFISCDLFPRSAVDPETAPARAPARGEIYISGGNRLTLSELEALRLEYPKVSASDLVRMALDAQSLATAWREHGDGNALREAMRCVRILYPPAVSAVEAKEALALLSRAFGIQSREELETRTNKARQGRIVEWNPDLVREYGLQATP
jgi:hypothetical protein